MRIYARDRACRFRFTRAEWGAFSNFQPLDVPIAAGPWTFATSEALYQAGKFAARPDVQQRIAEALKLAQAVAIGRTPSLGIDPGWNAQRVDVMRWVLRLKHEANPPEIDAVLAATADRPIVEVSARDPGWSAPPVADRYEGRNVLGRLWMELRKQLRDGDSACRSRPWLNRIRVGRLACRPDTTRENLQDLCHTVASNDVISGENLLAVGCVLGHGSHATTAGDAQLAAASARVGRVIGEAMALRRFESGPDRAGGTTTIVAPASGSFVSPTVSATGVVIV